jgi:hypothetical protein
MLLWKVHVQLLANNHRNTYGHKANAHDKLTRRRAKVDALMKQMQRM